MIAFLRLSATPDETTTATVKRTQALPRNHIVFTPNGTILSKKRTAPPFRPAWRDHLACETSLDGT
jgi:hypothetical protein